MIACRRCGRPESAHWFGYCYLRYWVAIAAFYVVALVGILTLITWLVTR